ncbi:MAG: hypothetical protein WD270_01755, partial [Acetobacterales bacterium]
MTALLHRHRHPRLRLAGALLALAGLLVLVAAPVATVPAAAGAVHGAPDLSAYVLPDGTAPVICYGGGEAPAEDHAAGPHCPLCTLCKVLALPASVAAPGAPWFERVEAPSPAPAVAAASAPAGTRRARAPP